MKPSLSMCLLREGFKKNKLFWWKIPQRGTPPHGFFLPYFFIVLKWCTGHETDSVWYGYFFRSSITLYGPYQYGNGLIRSGGSRGEGFGEGLGGWGVIIEKNCFISCFGPFAAFFSTLKLFSWEGVTQNNLFIFELFPWV